jgi:predicted DNA-binding transcriptional regulator YafY
MAKIEKILELISLLNRRPVVKMADILTTCSIPRRTAFRYLNDISEANIPVYYDRELHAYRLTRSGTVTFDSLTKPELILLIAGMHMISPRLGGGYGNQLDELKRKLSKFLSSDAIQTLAALSGTTSRTAEADSTRSLTFTLCALAAIEQFPITIRYVDSTSGTEAAWNVERPSIIFSDGWRVADVISMQPKSVDIDSITHVLF